MKKWIILSIVALVAGIIVALLLKANNNNSDAEIEQEMTVVGVEKYIPTIDDIGYTFELPGDMKIVERQQYGSINSSEVYWDIKSDRIKDTKDTKRLRIHGFEGELILYRFGQLDEEGKEVISNYYEINGEKWECFPLADAFTPLTAIRISDTCSLFSFSYDIIKMTSGESREGEYEYWVIYWKKGEISYALAILKSYGNANETNYTYTQEEMIKIAKDNDR